MMYMLERKEKKKKKKEKPFNVTVENRVVGKYKIMKIEKVTRTFCFVIHSVPTPSCHPF